MKNHIKNLFLVPALIAGLGSILAGRATAQTFSVIKLFAGMAWLLTFGSAAQAAILVNGSFDLSKFGTAVGTAQLLAEVLDANDLGFGDLASLTASDSTGDTHTSDGISTGFTHFTFSFEAVSTLTRLQFTDTSFGIAGFDAVLDNVDVNIIGVVHTPPVARCKNVTVSAGGVELTAAQKRRLEQIAEGHRADLEQYKKYGLTWSSISPEQVEFEKRLLAPQMLEQNLVARKAGVAPSPDLEKQSRYEQARRELLDQLQARANITKAVPSL